MKKSALLLFFIGICVSAIAQFVNNGTTSYNNTGKVGIGINNPIDWLHIEENGGGIIRLNNYQTSYLTSQNITTGIIRSIGIQWNNNYTATNSNETSAIKFGFYADVNGQIRNAALRFFTQEDGSGATQERMSIVAGNVGIGVIQPTEKIHIDGNIRLSGTSRKIAVGSEGTPTDYLLLQDVGTGPAFQWVQDNSPRFSIEGVTGNVGIGIDSPLDSKLVVNGDIRMTGTSRKIAVGSGGSPSDYLLLQDVGSGPAFQWVQDGSPKFSIEGVTGNVGIGTTSPDAKLAVSGQVHAQEVKVSVAVPGPDYVFEKDYKLTSLEEIKTYIDQNKHLPEVPSAKEMEKNGVQLGEMNMLLLKKIEELTLHVIEQQTKMEAMQKEINQLKTK